MFGFRKKSHPEDQTFAEILGREGSVVVVQLPERQFPAVALQGDHLAGWKLLADSVAAEIKSGGDEKLIKQFHALQCGIDQVFSAYNQFCKDHRRGGFKL